MFYQERLFRFASLTQFLSRFNMKQNVALTISIILVLLGTLLCGGDKHEPDSKTVKELVHSSNDFAFKLLNFLSVRNEDSKNGNLFFSPTSISIAFAMVYLGSRGNTASQISKAFDWKEYNGEEIHSAFKALHEAIHYVENESFELKLANRMWAHNGLDLVYEFSTGINDFYGSEITLADFSKDSDRIRSEINEWVLEQTNGKIRDFLASGVLNSDTKLALINAIYFSGSWKNEFDKDKTFHGPFYSFGNRENKIEINMMSKTSKQKYYFDQELRCQVLDLPYSGNEHSMIILLPEELDGIAKLEMSLTVEKLNRWITLMVNRTVSVALPRFRLIQKIDLTSVLPMLGIKDLFNGSRADLSGITEANGLFVSHFIHKAHVDVNERGTEAAAATGVIITKRSLDLHEVVHADHPFVFLIRDHLSGSILFIGKVMKPGGLGEDATDLLQRTVADEL